MRAKNFGSSSVASLGSVLNQGGSASHHAVGDDLAEVLQQGDKKRKIGFRDNKKTPPNSLAKVLHQGN